MALGNVTECGSGLHGNGTGIDRELTKANKSMLVASHRHCLFCLFVSRRKRVRTVSQRSNKSLQRNDKVVKQPLVCLKESNGKA